MRFSGYFFVLPQDALHGPDPIHTTDVRSGLLLLNPREPILGGVVNAGDYFFCYEADEVGSGCWDGWHCLLHLGMREAGEAPAPHKLLLVGSCLGIPLLPHFL